jgi:transposase-like protein
MGCIPWQRYKFHIQQNARAYVPKQSMRMEVSADIRAMINASDRRTAELFLQGSIQKYTLSAPRLSAWMEDNLSEGYTVFDFPLEHHRSIRTTNSLYRINKEIRKRTRLVGVFPNEATCLRLISAKLMEISEELQIGKHYCGKKLLNF